MNLFFDSTKKKKHVARNIDIIRLLCRFMHIVGTMR